MRFALFALLLALPLTACDPDAGTPETPVLEDAPGGDTGLPDTLRAPDPGAMTPEIESAAPGDTGLPDTLR